MNSSPYLKPGRLGEVIAAIQVMGSHRRAEDTILGWTRRFEASSADEKQHEAKWEEVFREHSEFFKVYALEKAQDVPKAALRWRYAYDKTYDEKKAKELTSDEIQALPKAEQQSLTNRALDGEQIEALINTAIELHSRAIAERQARWYVPLLSGLGGVVGSLIGALFGTHH
jgi:hypothetical protein